MSSKKLMQQDKNSEVFINALIFIRMMLERTFMMKQEYDE